MVQAAGVPDFKLIKTSIFLLTITLDWHRTPCMLCYKGVYTHRYDPSVSSPASTYLCRLTGVLSDVLPAESVPCWWPQDWKETPCRSGRDRQAEIPGKVQVGSALELSANVDWASNNAGIEDLQYVGQRGDGPPGLQTSYGKWHSSVLASCME